MASNVDEQVTSWADLQVLTSILLLVVGHAHHRVGVTKPWVSVVDNDPPGFFVREISFFVLGQPRQAAHLSRLVFQARHWGGLGTSRLK